MLGISESYYVCNWFLYVLGEKIEEGKGNVEELILYNLGEDGEEYGKIFLLSVIIFL